MNPGLYCFRSQRGNKIVKFDKRDCFYLFFLGPRSHTGLFYIISRVEILVVLPPQLRCMARIQPHTDCRIHHENSIMIMIITQQYGNNAQASEE